MTEKQFKERFIKARRAVIERDFSRLNDMQRQAVMTTEGPLLLLAGAGSGKTTVLINRVANLLRYGRGSDSDYVPEYATEADLAFLESYGKNPQPEDIERAIALTVVDPVQPWRIIAITFTNKAADELRDRLEKMLGPEAGDIWALTFHSACVRILRRDIERLGYDRSFTIYDTSDSLSVIKKILKELEMDDKTYPPRSVLGNISRAKDAMLSPEELEKQAENTYDIRKKQIARAYSKYARRLKEANALDFDDIILLTVKLLQENADVREYYQRKFRYVLIDEYQDTNNLQYLLAGLLAGGYKNICVVGDDDQSIYKFRGATIENILNFESQYKNARTIRLEQNYRSTSNILNASNAVIQNNIGRKGKSLWTDSGDGEKLKLHVAYNENDEAQYVANQILSGYSQGRNWRDFTVLYRMNAQSNQFEYAFKRSGIPYKVIGGTRFFDRAEIKDMLAYLCVIANPDDDLRLVRIINTPTRGIGQRSVETALAVAAGEGISLYAVLRSCRNYPELQRSAPKLGQFTELMDDLRIAAKTVPLDELYDLLIEKTGYTNALTMANNDESRSKIENVNELKTNIIQFMKESEEGTLSAFLEEIALYTDIDQLDADDNCVKMMTMHCAKGLEFPTVFIVGAEDGIFPGLRSIGEPDEMEEERRLCYVAMTRAKEKLFFTAARQRMLFGRTTANKISRFVEEIPDKYIEKPPARISESFLEYGNPGDVKTASRSPKHVSNISKLPSSPGPGTQSIASYKIGDKVNHRVFGVGCITLAKPMGGDVMIEIDFETAGKKKMMLKYASANMEKLD